MNNLSLQTDKLLKLAKEIAREYGLGYVGTEHLLLAIIRDGTTFAAEILRDQGANEYATEQIVEELTRTRTQETWVVGRLPGTPHFVDVLDMAAAEARGTSNWQIQPEHLLLGLLAEPKSLAFMALEKVGASTEAIRKAIISRRNSGVPAS